MSFFSTQILRRLKTTIIQWIQKKQSPAKKANTILIVDDEQMVIEPLCILLKRFGYHVISANNGAEAVNLFKKDGHNIDLVVLDLMMPGMNGIETFHRLQRIHPEVPVFIARGSHYSDQIDDIIKKGCNGFVPKPYSASELHVKIQNTLTKQSDII